MSSTSSKHQPQQSGKRTKKAKHKKRKKATTSQSDVAKSDALCEEKLSLATSSKDYGGNLELPEKVKQREYETTGQFFRRLDRLVAKAKVEASMESRFDMNLNKNVGTHKNKKSCRDVIDDAKLDRYIKKRRRRY